MTLSFGKRRVAASLIAGCYMLAAELLLFPVLASAQEQSGVPQNSKGKYDLGAVCDFVTSRILLLRTKIEDDNGKHSAKFKDGSNLIHFEEEGFLADYLLMNGTVVVTEVSLKGDRAVVEADRHKHHLLNRLGFSSEENSDSVSAHCDDIVLTLYFHADSLTRYKISTQEIVD